jgi:hypothetical protein
MLQSEYNRSFDIRHGNRQSIWPVTAQKSVFVQYSTDLVDLRSWNFGLISDLLPGFGLFAMAKMNSAQSTEHFNESDGVRIRQFDSLKSHLISDSEFTTDETIESIQPIHIR